MGKSSSGTSPSVIQHEDRLNSWKEIAAYLNRDVTTVQRWEKREGMPVRRHLHDRLGSVHASRAELDMWALGRNPGAVPDAGIDIPSPIPPAQPPVPPGQAPEAPKSTRWMFAVAAAGFGAVLALGASLWLQRTEYFWRNPIADARVQTLTEFGGAEQAGAISRDGQFVAFLSDEAGQMDVWVTQIGSGEFHNLTRGNAPELVNSSVRTLGFSPDGSLVTFWGRQKTRSSSSDISVWAVPTLGGEPRPYLEDVAEFEWSRDGSRLAWHTPGPGDPLFVTDGGRQPGGHPIFTAPTGQHSHFPSWSPDMKFIYFVEGSLPDKLDIWRIPSAGGAAERITSQFGRVSHPVLLDGRTLIYVAGDSSDAGPWLYSMDLKRRVPHQLTSGLDRYTSLAASADAGRLVATRIRPKTTLWRVPISGSPAERPAAARIPLETTTGFAPRLGPGYLLYLSVTGVNESIWKIANGESTELWSAQEAQILGGPGISRDGRQVAFSVRQHGRSLLYIMQADGTNARVVADSLDLKGSPAWAPDGSITVAADSHGFPHLVRVPVDGRGAVSFVRDYSVDPTWSPDGRFAVYSGADIGTKFSVKAITSEGGLHALPELTLTRGARHLAFLPGGLLVYLRGEIEHKNLWLMDLRNGAERQLTSLTPDFAIRDFDISPDGREVIFERVEERSDVVLLDLHRP